jgi:hypothetical protein
MNRLPQAVTVSVGYDDLLALTLPLNLRHFDRVTVVSSPGDERTHDVVGGVADSPAGDRLHLYLTDDFTRFGASFNKGLALEGVFDTLGREGWLCYLDADTLLPDVVDWGGIEAGHLYSARRRMLADPRHYRPGLDWAALPLAQDIGGVFPGYFHIWHASDPRLAEPPPPWYDVTLAHAGGGDGFFQSRWPRSHKRHLPFDVLHLGPRDTNWYGRASPRLDGEKVGGYEAMYRLHRLWRKRRHLAEHERYDDRVPVPGHSPRPWVHGRDE